MIDKIVKLSIVGAVLMVGFSAIYYTTVFLPKREEARLEIQREQQDLDQAKEERLKESELFERRAACRNQFSELDEQFNNVQGTRYDEISNTCIVIYRDLETGETEESPVEFFQRVD